MNEVLNYSVPFLAAMIGGLVGIYLHGRITKDVKVMLAFSGSYLFALTIFHLLPSIFGELNEKAGYFILIGFILQITLDYFSKGVEHGHVHTHEESFKVFPIGIYLSLFIHSFIEGFPLSSGAGIEFHEGHYHGNELLIGIGIHKIPEAIALAALLFHFYSSKIKVMRMIVVYALATPLGIIAGDALLNSGIEDPATLYTSVLAVAVGIFLHVSTTIIFEADEHHNLNAKKIAAILLGIGLVLFL